MTPADLDQPAFIRVLTADEVTGLGPAADGPLAGLPFAVKDNIDVAGVPTTAACPSRVEPATGSATAVQRLLDAGARPVGKTNMDQFATGLVGTRSPYGACHSVASAAHVSGGSSSGSAVAVAAGVVPLALGTDTAGSGRVPAAFNGLVGMKPTRGLVPTRGVLPAAPSLDCVTTLTRTVALARTALGVLAGHDPADPWSRPAPAALPPGVARRMRVVAVPDGPLDLDPPHRAAWEAALAHAATVARLVPVDVSAFLEAAQLLYGGPFLAERLAAFGQLLEPDHPGLDPVVRRIVLGARPISGADVYRGQQRLAELRAAALPAFLGADALLLPVTPGHPTLAEVAADPVGVNARLGTYTNMVNLLDLCAVAVPAGTRADGLPFGVQLLAPAFADGPLLDLAARWCGEPVDQVPTRSLLAVAGAHLTGQPLNPQLVGLGGRLHARARTAGGYRMYRVPGALPRPGLVRGAGGPPAGIEVEVWDLPAGGLGELLPAVAAPLALGPVELDDGTVVPGFLTDPGGVDATQDISGSGGWRAHLAARIARGAADR
ncbi:allophanate hydrolase [Modestobacter sp. I12A-02628]|uniref:Allophanate hydrolase n=1 Tax=Goekera deserti TaxID=2497753 RepID=A0A7K3WE45_9ACTN|nr:allophanate hydrolase [Goekera deserti]NDI46451.1 allophanate hydrolase [Goekera deserti]NEL54616.1 allophanate hydrolase [Goekera deserti]